MSDWRLLIDRPRDGLENMAIDEAILISCNDSFQGSTFRLYEWSSAVLSLGCFQKADNIINCCSHAGIPFVRRITGGRAVLHLDEITYSIVCHEEEPLFNEGISGAYRIINRCLFEALAAAGVKAQMHPDKARGYSTNRISCFHSASRYEIIANGKKLAGSAQRRFKKAFLQHGSILFGIDEELVSRLFGKGAVSRMTWLRLYSDIKKDEFKAVLAEKIREGLNIRFIPGRMSDKEVRLKEILMAAKYADDMWNLHGIDKFHLYRAS